MITARDRKIVMALVPLVVLLGYWFVILAPKRAESHKVAEELSKAQSARDTAEQQVAQLNAAKASFASDYATVIRLGKAIPTSVDMPSLLVQLDRAARGTGIVLQNFKPGAPTTGNSSSSTAATESTPPGGGANPASPDAPKATGPVGGTAQHAGNAVGKANSQEQSNADKANSVGGTGSSTATTSAPGLVSVPLTFSVSGGYFGLSDFLHRMKRFVRVVNDQIVVRGRLLTIESFSFERPDAKTPGLKAEVTATIFLTPPDQGTSAGATSAGPASAGASGAQPSAPSSTSSTPTSTPTPTATVSP